MTPWQHLLREYDPIEPLPTDAAAAIRRAVIVEARAASAAAQATRLMPVFALGGALVLAVVGGVLVARAQPTVASGPSASGDVTQVQFATPGGTRIIWQFNSTFTMQGTTP